MSDIPKQLMQYQSEWIHGGSMKRQHYTNYEILCLVRQIRDLTVATCQKMKNKSCLQDQNRVKTAMLSQLIGAAENMNPAKLILIIYYKKNCMYTPGIFPLVMSDFHHVIDFSRIIQSDTWWVSQKNELHEKMNLWKFQRALTKSHMTAERSSKRKRVKKSHKKGQKRQKE